MWALWCLVGQRECVDEEEQKYNYSVQWDAFREARACRHPLTLEDAPADLFEAMVFIRRELSRPMGERLHEDATRAGGVTDDGSR